MPLNPQWRGVSGFSSNAGTAATQNAGSLFDRAIKSFTGIAKGKQKDLVAENTASAMDQLRSLNTTQDFDANSGALSKESLDARFGVGNYKTEQLSKAVDIHRDTVIAGDRANLQYEQRQADRTLRLQDATTTREREAINFERRTEAYNTGLKDQADEKAMYDGIATAPTNKGIGRANIPIYEKVAARLAKDDFIFANNKPTWDANGQLQFPQGLPEGARQRFANEILKEGGQAFRSLAQQEEAFRRL